MKPTSTNIEGGELAAKLDGAFDWVYDGVSHDTDRPSFIKDPQAIKEVIAVLKSRKTKEAEIREADVVKEIQTVFFPYHKEPERSDPVLWLTILRVQTKEIQLSLLKADHDHARKEFCDAAFVAIDGLSKMGFDVRALMEERLAEIRKKDMKDRDLAYYQAKEKRLDSEVLALLTTATTSEEEQNGSA